MIFFAGVEGQYTAFLFVLLRQYFQLKMCVSDYLSMPTYQRPQVRIPTKQNSLSSLLSRLL